MDTIFNWLAYPFGLLMRLCYNLMEGVLHLPLSYVFSMLLFALITTLVTFWPSLNQQKSSAKMAAIQPFVKEIQKKYANDKQKQQEKTMKLYNDAGYKMTAGCLPTIIMLVLMLAVVQVVYRPLTYMLNLDSEFITAAGEVVQKIQIEEGEKEISASLIQNRIIARVQDPATTGRFADLAEKYPQELEAVRHLNLSIGGVNGLHLWDTPSLGQFSLLWFMPLFSVAMLILSMIITNRVNGTAQAGAPGTGKVMVFVMAGVSAVTAFMWPAGFSLYWGMRSLVGIGQSLVLRKIANPEKIKEETLARFNASKKARKELKSVKVTDKATGAVTEKTVTGEGLNKMKLQRAREIDQNRFGKEEYAVLTADEYMGPVAPQPKEKKDRKKQQEEANSALDGVGGAKNKRGRDQLDEHEKARRGR